MKKVYQNLKKQVLLFLVFVSIIILTVPCNVQADYLNTIMKSYVGYGNITVYNGGRAEEGIATDGSYFYTSFGAEGQHEGISVFSTIWHNDNFVKTHFITYEGDITHIGDIDVSGDYVYAPLTDFKWSNSSSRELLHISLFDKYTLDLVHFLDLSHWAGTNSYNIGNGDLAGVAVKDGRLYIIEYQESGTPRIFSLPLDKVNNGIGLNTSDILVYEHETLSANGIAFNGDYIYVTWDNDYSIIDSEAFIDMYLFSDLNESSQASPIETYGYEADQIHGEGLTFHGSQLWVAQDNYVYYIETPQPPTTTSGSLTVTINPSDVRASARWKLTSGPDISWKQHDETINDLPVGNYSLEFSSVAGWIKPDPRPISISEGSNDETGNYETPGIALKAPINLQAQALSDDEIKLTWIDDGTNLATEFLIWRATTPGDWWLDGTVDISEEEFISDRLIADTRYYYLVCPVIDQTFYTSYGAQVDTKTDVASANNIGISISYDGTDLVFSPDGPDQYSCSALDLGTFEQFGYAQIEYTIENLSGGEIRWWHDISGSDKFEYSDPSHLLPEDGSSNPYFWLNKSDTGEFEGELVVSWNPEGAWNPLLYLTIPISAEIIPRQGEGPRIIGLRVLDSGVIDWGSGSAGVERFRLNIDFDKAMDTSRVYRYIESSVKLKNNSGTSIPFAPNSGPGRFWSIDGKSTSVSFLWADVPVGTYTLTISDDNITDATNAALDGEFDGSFPSGDGTQGGDFVYNFSVIDMQTVSKPTIEPYGGTFSVSTEVTLSCSTAEPRTIYYTTDGTTPTTSSNQYTEPFTISSSCPVWARAFKDDYYDSSVAKASFTIIPLTPNYTLEVYSAGVSEPVSISSSTGHGGITDYGIIGLVSGTSVTLTAPSTVNGETFTGWTGSVTSGSLTTTFPMNENKIITANYATETLSYLTITGSDQISEESGAQFACTGYYSDGSSNDLTSSVIWSDNSAFTSLDTSGYLTTLSIPSDKSCTITAFCRETTDTYNFTIKNIESGGSFSAKLYGWGDYRLPNNSSLSNIIKISAGWHHNLALKSDGSLVGWGGDYFGQATVPPGNDYIAIGAGWHHSIVLKSDGSLIGNTVPSGNDFVAIATGLEHNLALKTDGSLVGWGKNDDGQTTVPSGNDFIAISVGNLHSLALKSDGSLVAWGNNSYGQTTVPAGNDFVAIAAGNSHNLALKSDGSLVGWGYNSYGQATVPAGNDFIAITAGQQHSIALKSDGTLVGWGSDGYGQATVPAGNDYIAIETGGYHSLAVKSNGTVVGWGLNDYCQASFPEGHDFINITPGWRHSIALKSDGSLFGWGRDDYGQATVPAGNDYMAIATGSSHNLALKSDGSLVGWGRDTDGQATVPSGNDYIAIAAGTNYNLALKSDGSLVGWGENDYGQATVPAGNDFIAIAAGSYTHSLVVKSDGSLFSWGDDIFGFGIATVPAGNDYIAIAAGISFNLALKSDGSLVGWGRNDYGQATVPAGNDYIAIAAGHWHCLALKSDGSLVGWGHGGQAIVPAGNDFIAIAAGDDQSLALKAIATILPNPDITGEGKVDLLDFSLLVNKWSADCTDLNNWCDGADINHSGSVGVDDLSIIAENWLEGVGQ